MKDDKQYIKEVYKKYENKIKEKKEYKKIIFNRVINIAAIFIIAISIIIIEKDKKERIVITDDVVKNKEEQKLNTIGDFENFYNIMKNYNSNTELYEYVKENLDVSKSESLNSDISSTNIQENNVDESDIVKIDKNNIYYIAEKAEQYIEEYKKHISGENILDKQEFRRKYGWSTLKYFHKELEIG